MDSNTTSSPSPKIVNCKRVNYLEWQEYFMSIAFLSAQRSKDPRTQVGACIVNQENKIVGIGYNGMPIGCNDDNMPWNKAEDDSQDKWLESKSPYVCHAELNAVLNKNLADIKGCIIYVALFPCNMCAQIIIQSGIKEVVYYSDKYHNEAKFKASRFLLKTAGVHYRQFRPRQKKIIIEFESIEDTPADNSNLLINTMSDNKEEFTTNNNNTGMKRTFFIEDQAEHQQLQNHLAHVHQVVQFVPVPTTHHHQKEALELNFAIVSLLLIACMAFFAWYISDPKLTR